MYKHSLNSLPAQDSWSLGAYVVLSYFTNCNIFICLNKSSALMVKTLFIQFIVSVRALYTVSPLAINHLLPFPPSPPQILNFCIKWPQRFLSMSSFDFTICQLFLKKLHTRFLFLVWNNKANFQLVLLFCTKPHSSCNSLIATD